VLVASSVPGCHLRETQLLRVDPSALEKSDRADVVRILEGEIVDGYGDRGREYCGRTYYEHYVRFLQTEEGKGVPNAILHLGSHVYPCGWKYPHVGEAFVQVGHGDEVCQAILGTIRRWDRERSAGREVDEQNITLACEMIVELRFRQYLHRHPQYAQELNREFGSVVLPEDLKAPVFGGRTAFHVDRVDDPRLEAVLAPRLLVGGDPVFAEAYERLRRSARRRN